MRQLIIDI